MAESVREAFLATARAFRQAGIDTPELDARLLVCHAAGLGHEAFIARAGETLSPGTHARLHGFIARRLAGEPVSRIIGRREFYGRDFLIDANVLDPRPDTETLIDAALDLVARQGWRERPLKLLDLGTGSGCILLTLLAELPQARGVGTDISAGALRLASANARRLGVGPRAQFIAADWLEGVEGSFDLILSNPPYIPASEIAGLPREVAGHDPRPTLDGGIDGLGAYQRIAEGAPERLGPGGALLVEIGATQGEAVARLFRQRGLAVEAGPRPDLSGRPRCLVALSSGARPGKIGLEKAGVRVRFMPAE